MNTAGMKPILQISASSDSIISGTFSNGLNLICVPLRLSYMPYMKQTVGKCIVPL